MSTRSEMSTCPVLATQQRNKIVETAFGEQGLKRDLGGLTFRDVCYEASARCGRSSKIILNSCSGVMRSGVNAIMGPTGSGKTTLLDILADRKGRKGISGSVLVKGKRRPKNFKCISGYVVQDDLMMGVLTVRENLQFSAALRLPSNMTYQQRRDRVDRIIEQLGLQGCANTKIGTQFLRGVSGGERKRTAVGMELIIQPPVLFLDEPTTGLDARTATSVLQILHRLSHASGTIVILSIHQPRYSIFKLFNTLTLLSRGQVVFHGPAKEAMPYFDKIGFKCPEHENPADFFLDVLIASEDVSEESSTTDEAAVDKNERTPLVLEADNTSKNHHANSAIISMVEHYRQSELYRVTERQIKTIFDQHQQKVNSGNEEINEPPNYATNIFWQVFIVSSRSLMNTVKNPLCLSFLLIYLIIFGLLAGIVYFGLGKKPITESSLTNVINDRFGAFFFAVMNMVSSNQSGNSNFIKQKALFIHENASGYYRVSVYFIAYIFSDMLPKRIIPVCIYAVLIYFMSAFQLVAYKFFIFLLTLLLTSITASTVTYASGSLFNTTASVYLFNVQIFKLSTLFGGFFIALDSLPPWSQWLKYLSLFHYALEALSINEIAGELFYANSTSAFGAPCSCHHPTCLNGTEVLINRGFETSFSWIWYDHVGLLAISAFFLAIFFINLQLIKKHK